MVGIADDTKSRQAPFYIKGEQGNGVISGFLYHHRLPFFCQPEQIRYQLAFLFMLLGIHTVKPLVKALSLAQA